MPGKKVLVVATEAPDESQLREALGDADEVRVVAPAAKISKLDWLTNAEDDARDEAAETAERVASAAEGEAQVDVDRSSQNTDAAQDVADALREFPADEIVVVAAPGERSTWLEDDAARRALEAHGVPVRQLDLT